MATTSDIRNGLCIDLSGKPYQIIEFLHVKPGKGSAFVRTKLRNLNNGKILEHTFPVGSKINEIRVENRAYQFLYDTGEEYHFMNMDDFTQIAIQKVLINAPQLLKEGMQCNILFHTNEEIPLVCELPQKVVLKIVYTEPGIKGNTVTNASKLATLETGAEIKVPLFIEQGEKIVIDTAMKEYKERYKE